MSLQERIKDTAIAIGNRDLLTQLEADRQREHDILAEEILRAATATAFTMQRQLVEKLRSLGITNMIEEITGTTVPKAEGRQDNSPWDITLKGPIPLPSGKWNTDVNLGIERILDVGPDRGRRWLIEVNYTQTGQLAIRGQETTYSGVVARRSPKKTKLIEDALVKAFANPRIY